MQFQFNGEYYRIIFRHDPPLDLASHPADPPQGREEHVVEVRTGGTTGPEHKVTNIGRPVLVCATCTAKRGGIVDVILYASNKKALKYRGTTCIIAQVKEPAGPNRERAELVSFGVGRGKVNLKAKDRFTRAGGCAASLEDSLRGDFNNEFREACRLAYQNRTFEKMPQSRSLNVPAAAGEQQ